MLSTLYYYFIVILPIILEGFPVSSSGHVVLLTHIFDYFKYLPSMIDVPEYLDHLLHGPVAFVLLCFFYKRWLFFLIHLKRCLPFIIKFSIFVAITTSLTAIGYFFFHDISTEIFPLYYGYALTSFALLSLYICPTEGTTRISLKNGFILGIVQALSLLPGISRFGFTYVIARWLGFSLRRAFEISFFIEVPISIAGFAKGLWSFTSVPRISNLLHLKFLCTMLIASCLGLYGFYIVYNIVLRNRLWMFGFYTMFLAILSWLIHN